MTGAHDAAAHERLLERLREQRLDRVRIAWCDLHGMLRGKTLMPAALRGALTQGVTLVSTLMLKDTADFTAYKIFQPGALDALPGFGMANNLLLRPEAESLVALPWAPGTGWMRAQPHFTDGAPVPIDARHVLQQALARLAQAGYAMVCGLEVEFHIYRIDDARLDPAQVTRPAEPPAVSLLHPGYNLLAEACADQADQALAIVEHTALGLGLPLKSLEIELGPSQVEAVFEPTDALTAADHMVRFRNGVQQALRRAGYLATFMCRPPFTEVMASGWHLHQSLIDRASGRNAFVRDAPAAGSTPADAGHALSEIGAQWLAGLLDHARGACVFAVPSINGYGRFRPHALAPQSVLWGRDNRGALLRVLGAPGDPATRIENRLGEPMANPYLYIASQVHAGLDGLSRRRRPPPASADPYAAAGERLPASLGEALDALAGDSALCEGMGAPLVDCFTRVKRQELSRHDAAEDQAAWQRREYFGRF